MGTDARFEYPAGWLDEGEDTLEGAIREFEEETGAEFPENAKLVGTWVGEDGEFQGYVFEIAHQDDVEFGPIDGTETSGVVWWDIDDLDDKEVRDHVRDGLAEVGPLLEQATKEARGYELSPRSGMVSLDVAPGILPVVSGGIDDHHITIVYLGKDVDDEMFAEVCAIVRAIAATTSGPLNGSFSGLGTFPPSESSDGKVPVFVKPDVPGIEALRAPLERFNASQFTDFKPHATLAYVDEGDELPQPLEPTPVSFTHLTVHRGDDVVHFPFRGCEPKSSVYREAQAVAKRYLTIAEARAAAPKVCPCGLPIKWDPIDGPQHEDGSISHDDGESVSDKVFANDVGRQDAIDLGLIKANPLQRRGQHGYWEPTIRWEFFHQRTDEIVDRHTPEIEAAMAQIIPADVIQRALNESFGGMFKAAPPATARRPATTATPPPPAPVLPPNQAAAVAAASVGLAATAAGLGTAAVATVAATSVSAVASATAAAASAIVLLTAAPLALGALIAALTALYAEAAREGALEAARASRGAIPDDIADVVSSLPASWAPRIARTQVARVGNAIRHSIEAGETLAEARAAIDAIIHDTPHAELIAETEFLRASAMAREDTYRLNRVEQVQWLTRNDGKVCRLCVENAEASPQPLINPRWPNGGLPVHPGDRCVVAPA